MVVKQLLLKKDHIIFSEAIFSCCVKNNTA